MPENINYSVYTAIKPHFDMLARLGYFKIVMKDLSPFKRKLHKWYRIVVWLFVFVYNLQHFIRIIEVRKVIEKWINISKQVKYIHTQNTIQYNCYILICFDYPPSYLIDDPRYNHCWGYYLPIHQIRPAWPLSNT